MRWPLWSLTVRSLLNRRHAALLTVVSIALSVALLVGVERMREEGRAAFLSTINGTDLVVGARSGALPLLLYSVFHMGDPVQNIEWSSIARMEALPEVDWVVPLSLGDSHRGYRVVGTVAAFFDHYRYGSGQAVPFAQGERFAGLHQAVVGAEVARALSYAPGDEIIISHGVGAVSFADHEDQPFRIVGVLAPTGTPLDRSVLVSLESLEAIHVGWVGAMPMPGLRLDASRLARMDLTPRSVTAALVGLHSRAAVFRVQRTLQGWRDVATPLQAVLPGVTLQQLWRTVAVVENSLRAVSALVVAVGLAGLVAVMVGNLSARRRELAILRSVGAGPGFVFRLLVTEGLLLGLAGVVLGLGLLQLAVVMLAPWVMTQFGIALVPAWPSLAQLELMGAVLLATALASLVPGVLAYRYAVADGMSVRL